MRAALQTILMIAIFCCGLHIAEPVQAHDETLHHRLQQDSGHDHGKSGKAAADADHAVHHHCPVAPAHGDAATVSVMPPEALLFASRPASLLSLSQAPPVEPPVS